LIFLCTHLPAQVSCDFAQLFAAGFEVFDDLLGENVRVGQVVGFFEAFVCELEDVNASFFVGKKSSSSFHREIKP